MTKAVAKKKIYSSGEFEIEYNKIVARLKDNANTSCIDQFLSFDKKKSENPFGNEFSAQNF